MKPTSASLAITFGRVNASARNTTSGWSRRIRSISQAQNAIGLVCGLSTRKMRTPSPIQYRSTSRHAFHSATRSASRSGQKLIG